MKNFEPPRYTYADYKNWKEDWELINGYPFQLLPSASFKHSRVQAKFIAQSDNSLNNNNENCNCAVFPELDWKINEETVVRPDIMIICGNSQDDYLTFPPVLIIEILSPSSLKLDRVIKFDLYQENGVQFYLMVDPLKEKVEVFELIDNQYKQVFKNTFQIEKNCQVEFDFNKVWK